MSRDDLGLHSDPAVRGDQQIDARFLENQTLLDRQFDQTILKLWNILEGMSAVAEVISGLMVVADDNANPEHKTKILAAINLISGLAQKLKDFGGDYDLGCWTRQVLASMWHAIGNTTVRVNRENNYGPVFPIFVIGWDADSIGIKNALYNKSRVNLGLARIIETVVAAIEYQAPAAKPEEKRHHPRPRNYLVCRYFSGDEYMALVFGVSQPEGNAIMQRIISGMRGNRTVVALRNKRTGITEQVRFSATFSCVYLEEIQPLDLLIDQIESGIQAQKPLKQVPSR